MKGDKYTLNKGLLFNQLPHLLLTAANATKSTSDMFVKLSRTIKSDPLITHDHAIFRKIRNNEIDPKELASYLELDNLNLKQFQNDQIDPEKIGAWFSIKSLVVGLKQSTLGKDTAFEHYWDFIEHHCELEHDFIKGEESPERIYVEAENYLKKWLQVESINLSNIGPAQSAKYTIAIVMYWGAVIELMLELLFKSDANSILSKVLPSLNTKNNSLIFSSEQFISKLKKAWGLQQYGKEKISWNQFYRVIKSKQLADPQLMNPPIDLPEAALVDPDLSAIKKRISRWKKGHLFTAKDFREYFIIINLKMKESEGDVRTSIYLLCNLFTYVQKELVKLDISSVLIEAEFKKYSSYKELVQNRFNNFVTTEKLES